MSSPVAQRLQVRALAQEVGANTMAETLETQMRSQHGHRARHKQRHTRHARRHRSRSHHTAGERFRQIYKEATAEQDSWVPEPQMDVPRFSEAPVAQAAPAPAQAQAPVAQAAPGPGAQQQQAAPKPATQQPVTGQAPPLRTTPVTGEPKAVATGPADAAPPTPTKTPAQQPAAASPDTLKALKAQIPAAATPVANLVKNESNSTVPAVTPVEPNNAKQPGYMPTQPERNVTCPDNCNGWNGYCNKQGTCLCKPGFSGESCNQRACLAGCTEHGTCDLATGQCQCKLGWCGFQCEKRCCPYNCNDRCVLRRGVGCSRPVRVFVCFLQQLLTQLQGLVPGTSLSVPARLRRPLLPGSCSLQHAHTHTVRQLADHDRCTGAQRLPRTLQPASRRVPQQHLLLLRWLDGPWLRAEDLSRGSEHLQLQRPLRRQGRSLPLRQRLLRRRLRA